MKARARFRWRRLAALGLGAGLLGGCGSRSQEAGLTGAKDRSPQVLTALSEASEAYQRGNLLRTEALLRQAYREAPDDPDLALDLGDTLNRLERNEGAREHYREFLVRHPSASSVRQALGLTLMVLGRWEEAAAQLRRLVAENPRDPAAQYNLGLVLGRMGRNDEALSHLGKAVELSPDDSAALAELGTVYLRLSRFAEAAAALEKAAALDPNNVPALFNLGGCYARLGRKQQAEETLARFSRASERKERFIDEKRLFRAAQARADELVRAGKSEKALEALLGYRASLEGFPLFQQELGVAYLRLNRSPEALAAFQRAVALDPALPESHAHLMALYQQAGDREKAMQERETAARLLAAQPGLAAKP